MTEAQALEAMLEFWEDGWGELHPDDPNDPDYVPFTLDNEAFTALSKWVRVTIVETTRVQTTSGPPGSIREEVRGRIAVQVFSDIDKGPLESAQLADDVRTALAGAAITVGQQQIALFEGQPGGPPTTDGRWYMRLVQVPYLYQAER